MTPPEDFGLSPPWYRWHEAPLVELISARWGGVRLELVTREADRPCGGQMCLPDHVVSFLIEGRRSGVINTIDGGTPRRVGQDAGWTRFVPAERQVRTHWDRGRRTYLMAFVSPVFLAELCQRNGVAISQDLREQVDIRDPRFARVLGEMSQELREPGVMHAALSTALAAEFCVHLLRLIQLQTGSEALSRGGLSPRALAAVLEMIERDLEQELVVSDLAAHAGLSVNHFIQAFRQSTGLPPYRYILEQRLARARRLMADASLSLTEIALRAGFAGSSQLATAFRRATGLTPSAWRRR